MWRGTAGKLAVAAATIGGYAAGGVLGGVAGLAAAVGLIRWEIYRGYAGYAAAQKEMLDVWQSYMCHGDERQFWVASARRCDPVSGQAVGPEEVVGSVALWEIPHDADELTRATCECHGGALGAKARACSEVQQRQGRCKRHAILRRMSVRGDMRGRRIAAQMMAVLKRFAVDHGFGHVSFEVSYPQRAARKMYAREGFECVCEFPASFGLLQLETWQWYADELR